MSVQVSADVNQECVLYRYAGYVYYIMSPLVFAASMNV